MLCNNSQPAPRECLYTIFWGAKFSTNFKTKQYSRNLKCWLMSPFGLGRNAVEFLTIALAPMQVIQLHNPYIQERKTTLWYNTVTHYASNFIISRSLQPKCHMILRSYAVLTWMHDERGAVKHMTLCIKEYQYCNKGNNYNVDNMMCASMYF